MSNHGGPPEISDKMKEALKELMVDRDEWQRLSPLKQQIRAQIRQGHVGKTGEFPEGKLSEDDEGEILFAISHADGKVVVNFGTPVVWFAMPPENARELARLLLEHAGKA